VAVGGTAVHDAQLVTLHMKSPYVAPALSAASVAVNAGPSVKVTEAGVPLTVVNRTGV
jgi:hypothetical protein